MQKLILPDYVHGIDVWRLALNLETPLAGAGWAALSMEERTRAQKFFRHEDRVRYAATRAALRRMLSEVLQQPAEALSFVTNSYGKPQLRTTERVDFNVSHSGRFALIAISQVGAVGVDIEGCSDELDVASLAPHVLTSAEQAAARSHAAFVERWVLKESILKALGVGISEHLQTLSVASASGGLYGARHPTLDTSRVRACLLPAPEGYLSALAWFVS